MIYVVIPIHNRLEETKACLRSIAKQNYKQWRVVICDDGSTDGSAKVIKKQFSKVDIVMGDGSYWWSRSVNEALAKVVTKAKEHDLVFILNNDVIFAPTVFGYLLKIAKMNPGYCIGTTLQTDRNVYEVEVTIDWSKYRFDVRSVTKRELTRMPDVVPADTLPCRGTLVPVSLFRQIGLFDQRQLPHYAADYDFFLRAARFGYPSCVATQVFMVDRDKKHQRPVRKSLSGLYGFLFSLKSPYNIKNHLILIARYCPGWGLKVFNMIRVVIGLPFGYFKL